MGETLDQGLRFFCDDARHLVCFPYSKENLHQMARVLSIRRHWYHAGRHPHYDIPKRRITEIMARCTVVSSNDILRIIRGEMLRSVDELFACAMLSHVNL